MKFDAELHASSIKQRLESYEDDTFATKEALLVHDSDDEEYVPTNGDDGEEVLIGVSKKKGNKRRVKRGRAAKDRTIVGRRKKGLERFNGSVVVALEVDKESERPEWLPRLDDIVAKVGKGRVKRRFCSVCGFEGGYRCTKCGVRYCSLRCGKLHDETRCLKYTV